MSEIEDAAALLVEVRRTGVQLTDFPPELVPETIGDAYAVQDAVLRTLGIPIAGWKVSPMINGTPPFCAPILADVSFPSPATLSVSAFPKAEVEVEVALRLDRDLPPRPSPYRREDIIEAVSSVHPALEILTSRFTDRLAPPRLVGMADAQSNGAIVYGPAAPILSTLDFAKVTIVLRLDDEIAGTTDKGAATIEVLDAVAWLADHTASRGWPLATGQIIITGARVGPLPLGGFAKIEAELTGIGSVSAIYG